LLDWEILTLKIMTYNNDNIQTSNSMTNRQFSKRKAVTFTQILKGIAESRGNYQSYGDVDMDRMSREYFGAKQDIVKQKAVTGAAANTGSAFVNTQYELFNISSVAELAGGIFRQSGFKTATGNASSFITPTAGPMGDLQPTQPGTSIVNDLTSGNPFINLPITIRRYLGEIPIYNDPVAQGYVGNIGQLLAVFEELLELKKLQREDLDVLSNGSNGITDNPANISVEILPTSGTFPIHTAVRKLTSKLGKYTAGRPVVYMNQSALDMALNEKDLSGNYPDGGARPTPGLVQISGQVIPDAGRFGSMAHSNAFLVPKIKNTYSVSASGVVTAQTGGNYTIIAVGVPSHAMVANQRREMDNIAVFTPDNNKQAFNTDQTIVAGATGVGGGIINPYTWGYVAVPV